MQEIKCLILGTFHYNLLCLMAVLCISKQSWLLSYFPCWTGLFDKQREQVHEVGKMLTGTLATSSVLPGSQKRKAEILDQMKECMAGISRCLAFHSRKATLSRSLQHTGVNSGYRKGVRSTHTHSVEFHSSLIEELSGLAHASPGLLLPVGSCSPALHLHFPVSICPTPGSLDNYVSATRGQMCPSGWGHMFLRGMAPMSGWTGHLIMARMGAVSQCSL